MSKAPPHHHLPNEIWLHILSHTRAEHNVTTAHDVWCSLRPASLQLKACVEQFFSTSVLQHLRLFLPITLPSYDQRNPLTGHVIFFPEAGGGDGDAVGVEEEDDVVWFALRRTEPEHYLTQFLTRWEGIKVPGTSLVKGMVWWELEFGGRRERMRFEDASVGGNGEGMKVGMLWKAMMTGFFRS